MNKFVHRQNAKHLDIFILDWNSDDIVSIEVFSNPKPEVGDVLMSSLKADTNFLYLFRIDEILENRDAKVSRDSVVDGKPEKEYQIKRDPSIEFDCKDAFFKLQVQMINQTKVIEKKVDGKVIKNTVIDNDLPDAYKHIDNSVKENF